MQNKTELHYSPGLCPNAEYLQPRMLQFRTNLWTAEQLRTEVGAAAQAVAAFTQQKRDRAPQHG